MSNCNMMTYLDKRNMGQIMATWNNILVALQRVPFNRWGEVLNFILFLAYQENSPQQVVSPMSKRPFGLCQGQFVVPADFDAPLPDEILREFEGA